MVRPVDSKEPWQTLIVSATSIVQAEAIARRMPLDVSDYTPGLHASQRHNWEDSRATMPLLCEQCQYPLEGLVISRSQTECPECGCSQLLFNCHQVVEPKWSNSGCAKSFVVGLAAIGGLFVAYISLLVLFSR